MDNFDIEQPDIEIKIQIVSDLKWKAQIVFLNGEVVKKAITLEDTPMVVEHEVREALLWLK